MRRFLVPALLFASVAAPALASDVHTFTRDGDRYSYTADRLADGSIQLNGRVESTGDAFKLHVANSRVNGRIGFSNVSFTVSHKLMAQLDTEVPANQALAAN
ncbi:MAG: hypothetical protein ACTHOJ_04340 [Sphingomonas oligoaromativorans]|jgi:hypothetical protein